MTSLLAIPSKQAAMEHPYQKVIAVAVNERMTQ